MRAPGFLRSGGLLLHHDRPVRVAFQRDVLAIGTQQRLTVAPQDAARDESPVAILYQDLAAGFELVELPLQLGFHRVSRAASPLEVLRTRLPHTRETTRLNGG